MSNAEGTELAGREILIDSTAPRRHIQEAGPKSDQGDQEVRYSVNGMANLRSIEGRAKDLTEYLQGTSDVRLDPQLNKKVWEAGIKGVPYRLRVRISRKRNDEEGASERLYSYVQAVNVKDAKGLQTAVVEE
jgi:hypothetical protein